MCECVWVGVVVECRVRVSACVHSYKCVRERGRSREMIICEIKVMRVSRSRWDEIFEAFNDELD